MREKRGDWKEHANETIEPFWDLITEHDPLKGDGKPAANHPTMSKATLKRKWKIPGRNWIPSALNITYTNVTLSVLNWSGCL